MSRVPMLEPGSTLGVLGGGQLGRMFAHAAQRMGYRVHVFAPPGDAVAARVADVSTAAPFDDHDRLASFASEVDAITLEFENVPSSSIERIESIAPVRPSSSVLRVAQQRVREKSTLARQGLPVTPFRAVRTRDDLEEARRALGPELVIKTATSGYDGRGQIRVRATEGTDDAWRACPGDDLIAERMIDLDRELSVIGVRGASGEIVLHGPIENVHRDHVLSRSICPTSLPPSIEGEALDIAREVLGALDVVGTLCVEFFLTTGGALLINEIAPRPHNSGHLTIEAFETSQFEQQVRAVCGLPLGSARRHRAAVMINLLGDLWSSGVPAWHRALSMPGVHLHLYGKSDPRPGRKMGHLTVTGDDPAEVASLAERAALSLVPAPVSRGRSV